MKQDTKVVAKAQTQTQSKRIVDAEDKIRAMKIQEKR